MTQEEKYISLSDLMLSIKESIKPVIIISLLLLTVIFYLAINDKDRWIAKVHISQINEMQFSEFAPLNSDESIYNIDRSYLRNLFFEELFDLDEVREAIIDLGHLTVKNFETEEDFLNAVGVKSYNLSLQSESEDEPNLMVVEYATENINEAKELLELALSRTNKNVQKFLINSFEYTLSDYEQNLAYQIEDIDKRIKNSRETYQLQIEADLAFLREQAEIARSLGISENALQTEFMKTELMISQGNSDQNEIAQMYPFPDFQNQLSQPYYLRGHISIEKEISLKENRSNISLFIPDLIKLLNMKENIIQDDTVKRMRKIFEQSPILKENFLAVNYDLAGINFDKVDRSNILFLGIFLLSILFVLFITVLINLTKNYLRHS